MELVASDSYGKKSVCNMQNDIESSTKIYSKNNTNFEISYGSDYMSSIPSSVSQNKKKWLNCNIGSSTSLDKLSLYTFPNEPLAPSKNKPTTNICEFSNANINGHDSQELHNTAIVIKKYNNIKELDKLSDINIDPLSSCGSENVEEYLLDLDEYLEKMDNECDKPISLVNPKGISSSLRKQNSSKINAKFERGSKARNTISCNYNIGKYSNILNLYQKTNIYVLCKKNYYQDYQNA